jgi:murein DD-endopeptidase MepM/ murein hydrolase activator NlpD
MQVYPRLVGITAFIAVSIAGGTAASAQTPQKTDHPAVTFKKEIEAVPAPAPPVATPQGRTVEPVLVIGGDQLIPNEAKVIPPAPRIIARAAGRIAVPGNLGAGDYRSAAAAVATPLQVNSGFGYRGGRRHNGIDFQASWGESVGAAMTGTVVFAGIKRGYGNLLIVDHGHGVTTYYAHLSAMYVGLGQTVTAGQVIGAIGTTGRSSGPHLHYEVRVNGDPINPTTIITVDGENVFVGGQPVVADAPAATSSEDDEVRPRRIAGSK